MKAIKWFASRDMRMVDIPKPTPKPHEALIRIESTGVCGSDLHYYVDGRIGATIITEPIILGHEYAGIVEDVGALADQGLIGKRVAVEPGIPCLRCEWCAKGHYNVCPSMSFPGGPPNDGAFCEYMCVHADFCFPVPDNIGAIEAAMIEPLAVAVHTVELALPKAGESCAIFGLGPVGLMTARIAKLSGLGPIYGVDLVDYRVNEAKRWDVDIAINGGEQDAVKTIMDLTHGRGVDMAMDCARSVDTPALCCRVARPGGRCILTGISGESEGVFPVDIARRKELTVQWCRRFRFNFPTAIAFVAEGKMDVRALVTHSFPLERTQDAFELVTANADGVLKASVDQ